MKKISFICLILAILSIFIIIGSNYIESKTILTKVPFFDIINNIEDIALACITSSHEKYLTQDNKVDMTIIHIVQNYKNYSESIIFNNQKLDSEIICMGRIEKDNFVQIYNSIFSDDNIETYLENNLNYNKDDNTVYLNIKPFNYFVYDRKQVISNNFNNKSNSEVVMEYITESENNTFSTRVKYTFDRKNKIQNIAIISSN